MIGNICTASDSDCPTWPGQHGCSQTRLCQASALLEGCSVRACARQCLGQCERLPESGPRPAGADGDSMFLLASLQVTLQVSRKSEPRPGQTPCSLANRLVGHPRFHSGENRSAKDFRQLPHRDLIFWNFLFPVNSYETWVAGDMVGSGASHRCSQPRSRKVFGSFHLLVREVLSSSLKCGVTVVLE